MRPLSDKDVNLSRTGNAALLRKVNESAVLKLLREEGPMARSEIARHSRLSAPTITRITASLIDSGLVLEREAGSSTGGRPPTLLEFNASAGSVIGVYIGQQMTGALANLSGKVLARRTSDSVAGDRGVEELVALVTELMEQAEAQGLRVRGVAVGAPSIVLYPQGVVVWSPTLGWQNLPLKRILEEQLGVPVLIENEVNLIALGESWRGAGRGLDNLVCISLGEGIGSGLILNGRLYRGAGSAAGEIGYMIPSERYLGQKYDTFGCMEGLAGSLGIIQRARARINAGERTSLRESSGNGKEPKPLTVGAILSAARQGDALAAAVVAETIDYLTLAIANLASLIAPERIIISGELAEYADLFIEPIQNRLNGLIPHMPDIVVSELRLDAVIFGAVAAALRETSDALFVQPSQV
ncbi:MAG: ROK family transcriptional regulator [Caldilineales bacterium]|nr:ROK family transcriptional regulator [Caldilineales bacterium]